MALLALVGRLVNLLGGALGRAALRDLDRLQVLYANMDDEGLRAELSRHITGDPARRDAARPHRRWMSRYQDTPALHALAIGVCLFDRHPCDLPPGSAVYDEQRTAAIMLIEGTNVQMATGEGKTYAVALAAVALLAEQPQVLVITANRYLAHRDRARVRPFLDAAGIASEEGIPTPSFRGVSYATLSEMCFRYLDRTYRKGESSLPDYPVQAAVIIDEIDSVLLDQQLGHALVRNLPSDENTWERVFELADRWGQEEYTYNPVSDAFSLTADAWDDVAELNRETGRPASLLMELASAALWARQATEGRHYLLADGNLRLINQVTGEPYDTGDPVKSALEHLLTGSNPPVTLSIAQIDGLTLLRRHPCVVGLSGTAQEDTLYYLQQLGSLTNIVPPRFPRYTSKIVTCVSRSREATLQYVADRIAEVRPRPVVIGAWSPTDALAVADWLRAEKIVDGDKLGVITAFDSLADAAILDAAGEPGRVTVLSQGGSRGLDVRSTHRPLLIVLGRAVEPRLDRQFLGRVGRHGEAFDAEFIIDPHSPVQVPFHALSQLLGQDVIEMEGPAARAFKMNQRDIWVARTRQRQQATILSRAEGDVEAAVAAEFQRLRELDGPEALRDYVAGLGAGERAGDGDQAADASLLEEVNAAIERRADSDGPVERFEAAVRAAGVEGPGTAAPYRFHTAVRGEPTELVALTKWLIDGAAEFASDGDGEMAALFRRQAAGAARQYLPVRTTPYRRTPVDVIFETRLMANAALIQRGRHRLDSLRASASREAYHRRGAFTIRNLFELSESSVRREVLTNLLKVDRPDQLDELYYSVDHQIFDKKSDASGEFEQPSPPAPAAAEAMTTLSSTEAETIVGAFVVERERDPGGPVLPSETARLLLLDVLKPLMVGATPISAAALRHRVRLVLDSLAAKGTRGGKLREHRRLIFRFTDSLYDQGILRERLTHETPITGAIRRVRAFVTTIPPIGVAAVVGYLAMMALAVLPVTGQARHFVVTDAATRLFGFGTAFPDRPFLAFFAIVITFQAAARTTGLVDPTIFTTRVAPLLAIATSVVLYGSGVANLGWTILLAAALMVWSGLLLSVNRFVTALIGVEANAVVGAGAVLAYLVGEIMHGRGQAHLLVIVGILAAIAGPAVSISIGSREYAQGRFRDTDDRARIRVVLDPTIASGLAACLAVSLAIGVRGVAAMVGFVLVQIVILVLIAGRRLSTEQVKSLLARLQVGTPLSDDGLRRHLSWALAKSAVIAAATLPAVVAITAWSGDPTTVEVLLEQWAGVVLLTGIVSATGVVSVAGAASPLLPPLNDDAGALQRLREQLRSWRRMRFAWVWKTMVACVVVFGILRWISDWVDVIDLVRDIGHWVT